MVRIIIGRRVSKEGGGRGGEKNRKVAVPV